MNQFPFKGRWVALTFAVMTLFVAYLVAGGRGDDSAAAPAEATGEAPPLQIAQDAAEQPSQMPEEMDDSEFVDDDSLIDQASGDDPTPPDDGGNVSSDDFGDSGDDGGDSVVTTEPPQFTPDGTPITPGTS